MRHFYFLNLTTQNRLTLWILRDCVMTSQRRGRFRLPGLEQRRGVPAFQNKHRLFPKINVGFSFRECTHRFSQSQTQAFESQGCLKVLYTVGLVVLSKAPYVFMQSGRMEEEPFSWLTLSILFACVRVETCHPWNCMCSTSTHHPCASSLAKT